MTPRTVLITGTSSGIGLHTAVAAASAGWTVVATMHDTTRAHPDGSKVTGFTSTWVA